MATSLILTGDVNLLDATDPAVPFARVRGDLAEAALVFGNLERCLYAPPGGHSFHNEGFLADPGRRAKRCARPGSMRSGLPTTARAGRAHGNRVGMIARLEVTGGKITGAGFRFVRHDAKNQTVPRDVAGEGDALAEIVAAAARLGTVLHPGEAWVKMQGAP